MNEKQHSNEDPVTRSSSWAYRGGLGTAMIGIGLAAVGIVLTLDNLDMVDSDQILPYWPVLLMLLGLAYILRPSTSRCLVSGSIWIGIGAVLLLHNLGLIGFDIWDLWPLLLVMLGLSLLTKVFRSDRAMPKEATDTFEATAVLGAVTRRIAASAFRGGNATAILGACDIDLYGSIPDGETAEINTLSVLGGIEIRVPRDWEVQVKGTAILGAFEDKTIPVDGPVAKRLIIRGTAILAGVEIKS